MENGNLNTLSNILDKFAQQMNTVVRNNRIEIPEYFGRGYCAGYVFNAHIRMMIIDFELREELVIDNPVVMDHNRMILFKFQHVFPEKASETDPGAYPHGPAVMIATSRMNTDQMIAIQKQSSAINIEMDADYLKSLLVGWEDVPLLRGLLMNTQPLLFEQLIIPAFQQLLEELIADSQDIHFDLFFRRLKAEELVCRLLMELNKREEKHLYPLNAVDIQKVYKIRDQILMHPEKPPIIRDLAQFAGMSPTKLKRIFRQVFGNSIYNYYQEFRIREAARLIRTAGWSVTDTGYQLGFTNLSHFARIFKSYTGQNPKKYSRS